MRTWAALLVVFCAGCLDDALDLPEGSLELGDRRDGRAPPDDLSAADLAGRDLASRCTRVEAWPAGTVEVRGSPTEAPFDYVTFGRAFDGGDVLSAEIWHQGKTAATPYTVQLADTNYLDCEVCVLVDRHYDAGLGYGAPAYLALRGSVTVTRADHSLAAGQLVVSGTDLTLYEWDFAADRAAPGGGCYEVAGFSLSGSYSGDGGDPPRWKQ